MHLCLCALSPYVNDLKLVCISNAFYVCVSTCHGARTVCPFLHAYMDVNLLLCLNAWMHTCACMGVWLCTCVRAKQIREWFYKWTLDLLGTHTQEGGQFSLRCLPEPLNNDWDGRSCLLALQRRFETRKMTSQKNVSCALWPTPSSRVALSGSISCLFLGGELEP